MLSTYVLCAQLTRDVFAIAKFLFLWVGAITSKTTDTDERLMPYGERNEIFIFCKISKIS